MSNLRMIQIPFELKQIPSKFPQIQESQGNRQSQMFIKCCQLFINECNEANSFNFTSILKLKYTKFNDRKS